MKCTMEFNLLIQKHISFMPDYIQNTVNLMSNLFHGIV